MKKNDTFGACVYIRREIRLTILKYIYLIKKQKHGTHDLWK